MKGEKEELRLWISVVPIGKGAAATKEDFAAFVVAGLFAGGDGGREEFEDVETTEGLEGVSEEGEGGGVEGGELAGDGVDPECLVGSSTGESARCSFCETGPVEWRWKCQERFRDTRKADKWKVTDIL